MARGDFPSSKQDQFVVRFPEGMREQIRNAAEVTGRSMNAEIIHRLEKSFSGPASLPTSEELGRMERFFQQMEDSQAKLQALHDKYLAVFGDMSMDERHQLAEVLTKIRLDPKIREILGAELDALNLDVLRPKPVKKSDD